MTSTTISAAAVVALLLAAGSSAGAGPDSSDGAGERAGSQLAQLGTSASPFDPARTDLDHQWPAMDVIPLVAERVHERGAGRGFVSQRTDDVTRSISVVWKGDVPDDVLAYAASRPFGVSVTISTGARYSRDEASSARSRILDDPAAHEIGIVSASVNQDGSGLTLGVTGDGVTDEQRDRLARLAGLGRDEITVIGGRVPHEGYASRQGDVKP